jgi:hypothetical protein
MHNFPDDLKAQNDRPATSSGGRAASFAMGMALMLAGVAAIVGGITVHFAVKAERLGLFPFAGRLIMLMGVAVVVAAVALAGRRVAFRFGIVTLMAGIGMLAFGFIKLAEPSLRFFAPLGFFVALAGGILLWVNCEYSKEPK